MLEVIFFGIIICTVVVVWVIAYYAKRDRQERQ
jgi:hypothetical protein